MKNQTICLFVTLSLLHAISLPMPATAAENRQRTIPGATIYYFTFGLGSLTALTPTSIKLTSFKRHFDAGRVAEFAWILHLIHEKSPPAKCNKLSIHLLIQWDNGLPPILVDEDGNVCIGKQEYALRPSTLVSLYQALTDMFPQSLDLHRYELSVLKKRRSL